MTATATAPDYNKRWIDDYPDLGTGPIPTEPCISEAYYRLEQERVFPRVWLKVGRVEEIPAPGDYMVRDIAVCRTSVIVSRGDDGVVRAFHNVCSHRGNKLVWDHQLSGNTRSFKCRFHSWTYANNGRLLAVPDEGMFYGIEKKELGLTEVSCDIWEGFIFIHLDSAPKETLARAMPLLSKRLTASPDVLRPMPAPS